MVSHASAMQPDESNSSPRPGVSVAPNASEIQGKVQDKQQNPSGPGCILHVAVDQTKDVSGLANLARPHEGEIMPVYVHPDFQDRVDKDDNVEMRVTFIGNAANGAFVIDGDNLRRT